jgi:acetyl-CoA acetyltransferase
MDVYAERALRFAGRTGATEKDFAQVAVKNHAHGALNPKAQYRNKVTIEEVLASRRIAGPLSLLMCSPVGDGAAALVLCSTEYARRRSAPNPVRILATTVQSGREGQAGELVPKTARAGYETAGLGPGDLDVVECHDATTPAELVLYEQLGLCAPGDAAKLLWSRDVELGGRVPVNPSGGLISRGHPVGATGCAQIVELASQLRGRAADRQIPGARTALAQNSGGYLGPDSAACAVTILSL